MPISLAAKPEPVTVTGLPGAPLVRLIETLGFTVKAMSETPPAVVVAPEASTV
jgi:hypothetical protein